jgi:hypothetical protein
LLAHSFAILSSFFLLKKTHLYGHLSHNSHNENLTSLGLGLDWGCLLGFSPLDFSTSFSSLAFSLSFPKNTFPEELTNLIGFWKLFVGGGNTGGAGVVSSRFLRWLGLRGKSFLWWVFGGSGIFSPLPSPTLFAPSPSPSYLLNDSIIILN